MKTTYWWAVGFIMLTACSDKVAEPDVNGSAVDTPAASLNARVRRAARVTISRRSDTDLKQKTAALLRLFPAGSTLLDADVDAASDGEVDTVLGASRLPGIRVDHENKSDTFRIADIELANVRDGVAISEEAARQRFEAVMRSAFAAGIVKEKDYPPSDASMTRLMQGEGNSSGAPPVESVKEYRFFVPRKVDGIVLNDGGQRDLGMKVSIHRSGALRDIQLSAAGATVEFGGAVTANVDERELDERVEKDFPSSTIQPLGLRYSLNHPNGEPRQTYRVSLRSIIDGEVTNARAKTVYYSVSDPSLPPEVWPTPNPDERSDQLRPPESGRPGSSGTVVE